MSYSTLLDQVHIEVHQALAARDPDFEAVRAILVRASDTVVAHHSLVSRLLARQDHELGLRDVEPDSRWFRSPTRIAHGVPGSSGVPAIELVTGALLDLGHPTRDQVDLAIGCAASTMDMMFISLLREWASENRARARVWDVEIVDLAPQTLGDAHSYIVDPRVEPMFERLSVSGLNGQWFASPGTVLNDQPVQLVIGTDSDAHASLDMGRVHRTFSIAVSRPRAIRISG